jgi:hypothetical protein
MNAFLEESEVLQKLIKIEDRFGEIPLNERIKSKLNV